MDFSSKAQVHKLDEEQVTVDGKPVYVRDMTVGDRTAIAPMLGDLSSAAKSLQKAAKAEEEGESLRDAAEQSLSPSQFQSLIEYMTEYVFRVWCDQKGNRKYTDRSKFDEVPPQLVDAIYREAQKVTEVSAEEAEKN